MQLATTAPLGPQLIGPSLEDAEKATSVQLALLTKRSVLRAPTRISKDNRLALTVLKATIARQVVSPS